ncbi:MAG TPA: DUF4136 domain-containing protein [Cyclobacteriaceae bacterium]
MKIPRILFLLPIVVALLCSCAASRVKSEWDSKNNLSQYRSFRFIDSAHQKKKQEILLIDNTIHKQVTHEFGKRGVKEGNIKPSLWIVYHTYTEKVRDTLNTQLPMMYGGESWRFYPWSAMPYPYEYWNGYNPRIAVYTEGTLIIDAIDSKSKKLVWRGSISDAIGTDLPSLQEEATKAVELIFRKYPVKPKKFANLNP